MANPTNCFICKNTWLGKGPLCDDCRRGYKMPPPPLASCLYCGGPHQTVDCLAAAMATHAANMARKNRPPTPSWAKAGKPLKVCPACKGNYLIESKAGSVCSSCRTVVHNPCRNCTSPNTHGLSCPDDAYVPGLATTQMIECQDCTFME